MSTYYLAIVLTILSNIAYHLCAKKTDGGIVPLISLAATYFTALVLTLALLPFAGSWSWSEQVGRLNWASFGLGAAIVFLELGFILAYRSGWQLSVAALYSNVAVGICLLPLGMLWFGEQLSWSQSVGLVLSLAGLVLLSR